jgi:hypothetical protein
MADNLEDTKDIVAELEGLLAKSVEHAKELPKWMRKLLGVVDEVAILKAEIARLEEDGADAANEGTDNMKKGIGGHQEIRDLISGQLAFMSAFTVSIKSAVAGAKALGTAFMANPIIAILALAALLVADFARNWVKVREEMGGTVMQATELAKQISIAQRTSKWLQLDGKIVRDTAAAIAKEYGTINNVTAQAVQNIAEFAKLNSASVEDVVKLSKLFDALSTSSEDIRNSIQAMAIDAGILVNVAFKEISDNAEFFAMYTDDGARNIQRAVAFAKQLGNTLDTTAKISEKLLDVETAIQAQFKIQAVLGQRINLDEAIRLNFVGKVGAAQEELTKQVRAAVAASGGWENMKPILRKTLADELGLTGVEVMKMIQGGAAAGVGQTVTPLTVPAPVATDDNTKAVIQAVADSGDKQVKALGELAASNKKALDGLMA